MRRPTQRRGTEDDDEAPPSATPERAAISEGTTTAANVAISLPGFPTSRRRGDGGPAPRRLLLVVVVVVAAAAACVLFGLTPAIVVAPTDAGVSADASETTPESFSTRLPAPVDAKSVRRAPPPSEAAALGGDGLPRPEDVAKTRSQPGSERATEAATRAEEVGAAPELRNERAVVGAAVAGPRGDGGKNVTVFIGIKVGDPLGVRLDQVRRTWLIDALAQQDRIKVNFFSTREAIDRALEAPSNRTAPAAPAAPVKKGKVSFRRVRKNKKVKISTPATAAPLVEVGDGDDPASLRSLLVPTGCADPSDLRCGTSSLFAYYLAHHSSDYTYFCSFDDDQFVLVENLLSVLGQYDTGPPRYGRDVYVGNSPFVEKHTLNNSTVEQVWRKDMQRFLTGGAGYCLSSDLVVRGADKFVNLPIKYRNGDDVAVGHVVEHDMGVYPPIEDSRFHSHLEFLVRPYMPLGEVRRQVAFGINTKEESRIRKLKSWPKVPSVFSEGEDPLRFRSMRCFLKKEESGEYPPECAAAARNISVAIPR